jgi:hypothetical protein
LLELSTILPHLDQGNGGKKIVKIRFVSRARMCRYSAKPTHAKRGCPDAHRHLDSRVFLGARSN